MALLLALLSGFIGVHNAYLGYRRKHYVELFLGIVIFLLCLFDGACLLYLFILWLWAVVEVLLYNTDSDGNILGW